MVKAILSDIHGNLEALEAVLADLAPFQVEAIYCLGDVVGYGPNPRECLEAVMPWTRVIMGNHDHAVLFEPQDFNPIAKKSALWTRGQIEMTVPSRDAADARWEFLSSRPFAHTEGAFLFVHASPRQPLTEYIFPHDAGNPAKMDRLFSLFSRYCFVGHTHFPGVFVERDGFRHPGDFDGTYPLGERKLICNVGSVGQPRDGDWRACYVLLEEDAIHFRRVPYNVEATVAKVRAIPDLNPFLGDRLLVGH